MKIPLFPLATVLFPGSVIQLRIFETRYIDMVGDCMRENAQFGIVPIDSGNETTPTSSFFPVGVLAKIIDWDRSADGLLQITASGTEKFTVESYSIENNGLVIGEVEVGNEDNGIELAAQNVSQTIEEKFRDLLPLLTSVRQENLNSVELIYKLADFLSLPYSARVKILMSENLNEMLELVHNFVLPKNT